MTLKPGTWLAHYEILDHIGSGGMGDVYRARDNKLNREVALKVLPEHFARDPERVTRFRREAQLLAQLNHPNIALIYNFEEAGETRFLVMELVPGDTLRERIKRGPLLVPESLHIATQIAEALEHAHEKTIMHRDLKPANVKVTPEGKVKVLDFGLAKAFAGDVSGVDPHDLPTGSLAGTLQGTILGTPAYMSPEQADGKKVDKRTDIWAFGCLLYELLTGRQAFPGESVTEILAAVLKTDPDWRAMPAAVPPTVHSLLRRCLQKDVNRRLRDVADGRIEIEEALNAAALTGPSRTAPAPSPAVSVPQPIARLVVALPPNERLSGLNLPAVALSPDGMHVAYVASRRDSPQLYLRAMDSLEAKPIPFTEGASGPFFSPDGQWIGFFASGRLKKVSRSGGPAITLCDAPEPRGASWGPNDRIVFARITLSALSEVSAAGGAPRILTSLKEESSHRWPEILPGGKALLFTAATTVSNWDAAQIVVQSLETGERRVVVQGGICARYSPTGHIVYVRAGTLMALPFDLNRLEVTGTPVPVVEGVMQSTEGAAQFSFSNLGWLVYIPGGIQRVERTLVLVNRKGVGKPLRVPPRPYVSPRLSPDGQRLAVAIQETNSDVWVYDLSRDTLSRLTFGGLSRWPLWTPDGKRLAFQSSSAGPANLFWMPADGSGAVERLTTSEHLHTPHCWSPDGRVLSFTEVHPDTGRDIWLLPVEGERKPYPFLQTPSNESAPRFSQDGRWLAYVSDETGRFEVYVQSFPGPGGKWQISTEGGSEPVWNPNGRELFYRNGDKVMAVDIMTETVFTVGKPKVLFEGRYEKSTVSRANYDITPDGQRFLMVKPGEQEQPPTQINVVLNWFEELKRRVPTGR